MNPVPVFMYHHVNPNRGDMVTVTPDVFERQMAFLSKAGYTVLSAGELLDCICGKRQGKEKAAAVTFDDGYLDNYVYAFPVLKKYNIRAVIFIVTDWVERSSEFIIHNSEFKTTKMPGHNEGKKLLEAGKMHEVIMNWDMMREMRDSGLVEFYSHTASHRRCAQMPAVELAEELGGSKKIIEERLGNPCPFFCWPKGSYDEQGIELAKQAGYEALFTTKRGVVTAGSDRFAIRRIVVKDDARWFKNKAAIYTNPLLSKLYLGIRGS